MHATALASLPGCMGFLATVNRWCRFAQPPATPSDASGIHRPASAPNQVAAPSRRCATPPSVPHQSPMSEIPVASGSTGSSSSAIDVRRSTIFLRPAMHTGPEPRTHPGGMPECSRWLSEATPPDPSPPHDKHPGRGARTRRKRSRHDAKTRSRPPKPKVPTGPTHSRMDPATTASRTAGRLPVPCTASPVTGLCVSYGTRD